MTLRSPRLPEIPKHPRGAGETTATVHHPGAGGEEGKGGVVSDGAYDRDKVSTPPSLQVSFPLTIKILAILS